MKTLEVIMNRRTIRKFKNTPIPEEIVYKLIEAGQRAPTACSLQTYSIIWVKDDKIRKEVYEACGKQSFILEAPITLVVCADVRKILKIVDAIDECNNQKMECGYEVKLFSIIDATLAAQNLVIAAESLGLSSVYVGTALANKRLIELLKLPNGVLPLYLICIGYPDENPPIRPRLPTKIMLSINQYREPDPNELIEAAKIMIEKLKEEGYYEKYSKRSDITWIDNVKRKLTYTKKREEEIIKIIELTGYLPNQPINLK
ncbi:MAG: nitroreductase family protein [Candidatus Methanomethylicia archaeon]